jgi:hypothetical protein
MHKLFLTVCDMGEPRPVTADHCLACREGSVASDKSMVICRGATKYFMAACDYNMRSAATLQDCATCGYGEIGEDRVRVFCSVLGPAMPMSR